VLSLFTVELRGSATLENLFVPIFGHTPSGVSIFITIAKHYGGLLNESVENIIDDVFKISEKSVSCAPRYRFV
jgi:hypothetical protein